MQIRMARTIQPAPYQSATFEITLDELDVPILRDLDVAANIEGKVEPAPLGERISILQFEAYKRIVQFEVYNETMSPAEGREALARFKQFYKASLGAAADTIEPPSVAEPPEAETAASDGSPLICAQCDEDLKEIRFRDGTIWTPTQLANYGRRKHGRVLCMQHYREANEARKRAGSMAVTPAMKLDEIPF